MFFAWGLRGLPFGHTTNFGQWKGREKNEREEEGT